mmetsp:Transcript_10752/g.17524  ORF Transcript_10752/g.17524 Transcript_10752/m.17524 type:complete len:165 (+) Transcript_10752:217-711(+)
MRVLRFMLITIVAASAILQGAEAQFDVQSILERLDTPVPKSGYSYVQKAGPFVKMVTNKIEPPSCRSAWNQLSDKMLETARANEDMTLLQLIKHVCQVGDECFEKATSATQSMIESSSMIKGMISAQLSKLGIKMDEVLGAAPLVYSTTCSQIVGSNTDEAKEL